MGAPLTKALTATLLFLGLLSPAAEAQNWSQWLGNVDRNGTEGSPLSLSKDTTKVEPKEVWKTTLGPSYAAPIVHGDHLIALYSDGKEDLAARLDAKSGEVQWKASLGPFYKGHDGSIDGPLATPATDGEVIIALSGHGSLHALKFEDGTSLWNKDLSELGGRKPYFGFAASPLLDGDRVYIVSGGDKGKCVFAFDRLKGTEIWSSGSDNIEYSSPTLATLDGVPQLIVIGKNRTTSIAAKDGEPLWTLDAKPDGWATPLAIPGNRVFLPLEKQLMLIECSQGDEEWNAEVVWTATGFNGYSYSFGYRDGHIYGVSKRRTVCVDAESGEISWSERSKESSAVVAGDHLISLSRKAGLLRIMTAHPEGLQEILSYSAFPNGSHWTAPAAAHGLLYLRSGAEFVALKLNQGM